MTVLDRIDALVPPVVLTDETPLQNEKFNRLMRQHNSMKEEERSRIILWLLSLTLALLSIAELFRLIRSFRRRK